MRTFRVYIESGYAGIPNAEDDVEIGDDAIEEEIDKTCAAALEGLIENQGSGWYEIEKDGGA